MLHMEDEATLAAIMGAGISMTPAIQKEYDLRLRMMHRCGRTGALGPDQMVSMLRHLNFEPIFTQLPPERFDPTRVKKGEQVKVDGKKVATYCNPLPGGRHAIKYPDGEFIHEVAGYQLSDPDSPDEEELDWGEVKGGTPVVAILEDDGRPVEATFVRVDTKQDKLVVMPVGQQKHFRAPADNVAVVS